MKLCIALFACSLFGQSVLTVQYNNQRTGANTSEPFFRPSTINHLNLVGTFAVDGIVFAQPLIVEGISISGAIRGLVTCTIPEQASTSSPVYVAGTGGSCYLFNADAPNSSQIWRRNLVTTAGTSTSGCLSTPVIDPVAAVIYTTCKDNANAIWLYAMNLADGSDFQSRVQLSCTNAGQTFSGTVQDLRMGLALIGGNLYFGAANSGNDLTSGARGWLFSYSAATLSQNACLCTTPSASVSTLGAGGYWQSGGAATVDGSGNLWWMTGNGPYDGTANYSESFVVTDTTLTMQNSFTPANWSSALNAHDQDMSAGWPIVFGSNVVGRGKDGVLWLNPTGGLQGSGGTFGQTFSTGTSTGTDLNGNGGAVYCNSTYFASGAGFSIYAFAFGGSTFNSTAIATSANTYARPGAWMSCSSNSSGALLWAVTSATNVRLNTEPGTLRVFDPTTLLELWNSSSPANAMGGMSRFVMATISSGKIYVPTTSNYVSMFALSGATAASSSVAATNGVAW